MRPQALVGMLVAGLGVGQAIAQTPPNLAEILKQFDLVCTGATADGKLDCAFKPKQGAVLAASPAASPAPAPQPAPVAAPAPAPAPASAPASAPAAATKAAKVPPSAFDLLETVGKVDLSVPESPAFAVLGITPSEIQRPGTVRELGSSLIHAVDAKGKPKTGVALDFAPLPLAAPHLIRGGSDYASKPVLQAFTRTTVSLATIAAEDGKASKLAWGVRMGVFDFGDPGNHYDFLVKCLALDKAADVPAGKNVTPVAPANPEELKKCDPSQGLALWAKPALYVGYGKSWYSETGRFSNDAPATKAWWATYSQGYDQGADKVRALFMLHASRVTDDRVEDPNDSAKLIRQDSTKLIARLRAGKDTWHAFFDLGREKVHLGDATKESLRHIGVGAEFKVMEDIWFQVGTVRQSGYQDGTSKNMVTTGLRFGSKPVFSVR